MCAAGYNIKTYEKNPTHESDGYEAVVGTVVDLGGITSVDVFAGWMNQNYDKSPTKKKLSSPRLGGRLDWNVTGMTTVIVEANRTIEETTLTGYDSYYQTDWFGCCDT